MQLETPDQIPAFYAVLLVLCPLANTNPGHAKPFRELEMWP